MRRTGLGSLVAMLLLCIFIPNPSLAEGARKLSVCQTSACRERSKMVLRQLTFAIQPCEDYFGYVCQKWRGRLEEISEEVKGKALEDLERLLKKSSYDDEGDDKVAQYFVGAFKSCVREGELTADVRALQQIVRGFGIADWPLEKVVKRTYIRVLLESGLQPMFKYKVYASQTPGAAREIHLGAPTDFYVLSPDYADYYDEDTSSAAYEKLLNETIKLFKPNLTDDKIREITAGIVAVEKKLEELAYSSTDATEELTIGEFSGRTTLTKEDFPLLEILNKDFTAAGVTLREDDKIYLMNKTYYRSVIDWLKKNRDQTSAVMNYIGWVHVRDLLSVATTDLKTLKTKYDEVISPWPKTPISKAQACLEQLVESGLMYGGASKFYINKMFNTTDRRRVKEVAEHVRGAVQYLVKRTEWMDKDTKKRALARISNMTLIIGFEHYYEDKDKTLLEDIYRFVEDLNPKAPFVKVYFTLQRNEDFRRIRAVRQEYPFVNLEEYGPLRSHALYNEEEDILAYPAAALNTHYAKEGLPGMINYATLGANAARAMSNAFDKYDRINKTNVQFWSQETAENYCKNKVTKELQDIYCDNAKEKDNLHAVSLADHVAVRAAFQAYRNSSKAKDQLLPQLNKTNLDRQFFIFFASAFCPFSVYNISAAENATVYREGLDLLLTNYTGFKSAYACPSLHRRQY